MFGLHPLIAHQGGWDEILLFGIPVVVALIAVRLVERRHTRRARSDAGEPKGADEAESTAPEGDELR